MLDREHKFHVFFGLAFVLLFFCHKEGVAGQRKAIVFGNASYSTFATLDDSARDAKLMAETFRKIGITVHDGGPLLNLSGDDMVEAVDEFARTLTPGDEAFFYYSGHGVQLDGLNYFIPSDFDAKTTSLAKRKAVSLDDQLEKIESRNCKLVVMFLDCCRDTPQFLTGEASAKSLSKGLAEVQVDASYSQSDPQDIFLCFSTKHGQVAWTSDDNTTSAYTTVLADELVKPGLELGQVMRRVKRRVFEETKAESQPQTPFEYGSLFREYYLAGRPSATSPTLTTNAVPQMPSGFGGTSNTASRVKNATKSNPFVNQLGMKFVPVPETRVLFSIWETRYSDFLQFVEVSGHATSNGEEYVFVFDRSNENSKELVDEPGRAFRNPGYEQESSHPVVCTTFNHASAFCEWLSERDGVRYRLPTDSEWSIAAGLDESGLIGKSPRQKSDDSTNKLEGLRALPPGELGNLLGVESNGVFKKDNSFVSPMTSHSDSYIFTSPVGVSKPNQYGIFDLIGNVRELTSTIWDYSQPSKGYAARGSSFKSSDMETVSLANRNAAAAFISSYEFGFRVVIEIPE